MPEAVVFWVFGGGGGEGVVFHIGFRSGFLDFEVGKFGGEVAAAKHDRAFGPASFVVLHIHAGGGLVTQKYPDFFSSQDDAQRIPDTRLRGKFQGGDAQKTGRARGAVTRQIDVIIVSSAQSHHIAVVTVACTKSGPHLHLRRRMRSPAAEPDFNVLVFCRMHEEAVLQDDRMWRIPDQCPVTGGPCAGSVFDRISGVL